MAAEARPVEVGDIMGIYPYGGTRHLSLKSYLSLIPVRHTQGSGDSEKRRRMTLCSNFRFLRGGGVY